MQINKKISLGFIFLAYVNVLFLSLAGHAQAATCKYINYKIEPDLRYSCINITGTLNGAPTGEYLLRLPINNPNINFSSETGELKHFPTDDPTLLKVKNDPNEPINFKYTFCNLNPYRNIDSPIIERDFIEFNIYPALITFDDNVKDAVLIGIDLSSYSEKLKSLTSYNFNIKRFLINTSTEEFRDSIIAIGDLNVDQFEIKNNKVFVVSNGAWPYFKMKPSTYVKELIKTQRNFWNDHKFPMYAVFLVKQNFAYPVPKSVFGRHNKNVSILLLPEEDNKDAPTVLQSISHEIFHAWIGIKMKVATPQGNLQWYVEGFNDFYGLLLLNKSKLVSIEETINHYNFLMNEYFLSPLKTVTNQEIERQFMPRGELNRIATLRGHFIAKELRDTLSNFRGENNFDLAMKEILSRYQKEKWQFLKESGIEAVFKEYVGEEKWKATRKYINGDTEVVFSSSAFSPFAKLTDVEMDAPEFGFNLEKLIFSRTIDQLDVKSNAYKAGLRDGNKVKYYQLDHKAPNKEVTIAVDDNGTEKIIKFKPKVVKKMVPQYVMVRGDVFEKRLRNRTS